MMGRALSNTGKLNTAFNPLEFYTAAKPPAAMRPPADDHPAAARLMPSPEFDRDDGQSAIPPKRTFTHRPDDRSAFSHMGMQLTAWRDSHLKQLFNFEFLKCAGPSPSQPPLPASQPQSLQFNQYRDLCLHIQSDTEMCEVRRIGEAFRALRKAKGFTRSEIAGMLACDVELLVIVENGYGNLETAESLLKQLAKRFVVL